MTNITEKEFKELADNLLANIFHAIGTALFIIIIVYNLGKHGEDNEL